MEERKSTQGDEVVETLNKTELGQWMVHHKTLMIVIVCGLLVAIGLGSFLHSWRQSSLEDKRAQIYQFQQKTLNAFVEGNLEVAALMKKAEELKDEVGCSSLILPLWLELGAQLREKKNLAEAETILQQSAKIKADDYSNYMTHMDLAVVLEEEGKLKEAAQTLEHMNKFKEKLYEAKLYLDLGRVYSHLGDKEKARQNLQYLLDNFPNDELVKMARVYLQRL